MGAKGIFVVINFVLSVSMPEALDQSCDPTWLFYSDACFKLFQGSVSFSATRGQCSLNGARLVSSFTPKLRDFLLSSSEQDKNSSYWIKTSSSHFHEAIQYPATSSSQATDTPAPKIASKTGSEEEKCFYIQNKELHPGTCSDLKGFVCEKDSIPPSGTCPPHTDKIGPGCLWKVLHLNFWNEAQATCSANGGWLANLDSRLKMSYAIANVVLKQENFWVGAKKEGGIVKWGNGIILDLEEDTHFVEAMDLGGQCIALGFNNLSESRTAWLVSKCNMKAYALCETKLIPALVTASSSTESPRPQTTPQPKCPETSSERDGMCYWVTQYETGPYGWDRARKFCQSFGGDLASYKTAKEERLALGDTERSGGTWVGLRRDPGSNVFRWSDGSTLVYSNWAPGQPKTSGNLKLCVANTGENSTWEVAYCGLTRWFVCKIPKASIPASPAPPTVAPIPECSKRKTSAMTTWRFFNGYCYAYYELAETFSWVTAKTFCQDNGAHLASVHSLEELSFILSMRAWWSKSKDFWFGLRAKGLHSSFKWDDGTPLDFVYWDEGDTYDDSGDVDTCVSYESLNGYWRKKHCNNLLPIICKAKNDTDPVFTSSPYPTFELLGFCPDGWYTFGKKCYQISNPRDRDTWSDAKNKCEAIGSTLVSIHSKEEQDFVSLLMLNLRSDTWIGMYSTIGGRLFHWTDKSPLDFTNWDENEPNYDKNMEECVHLVFNEQKLAKWNDHRCSMRFPYICQIPKDPMLTRPGKDPFLCEEHEGWSKVESSCYKIFSETDKELTWLQAQSFCVSVSGNLASITNFGISIMLRRQLKGLKGLFWIGMRSRKNDNYAWLMGSAARYSNWLYGQPQEVSSQQNCVAVNTKGEWMVRDCEETHPFICEDRKEAPTVAPGDPDMTCPSDTEKWEEFGGKFCYLIETKAKAKWTDASHICFRKGGYLTSIHSLEELTAILHHIKDARMAVHIGLARKEDGNFGWYDRSAVDYVNWAPGEPNDYYEMCVEMHTDVGTWNDIPCAAERGYVCSVMKVPRNKSTSSLEDNRKDLQKSIAAGGIVGILICILVVVAIVAVAFYYFCPSTRMRAQHSEPPSP